MFLALIMLIPSIPVNASNTKTMTVTIGEGEVDQRSLSKTVNIPNLKNIESVSVDTGSVSYTKNGENVTLNVSGGTAVRSVPNPTKYSKTATDYTTSSTNSFNSTKSYSDADGYKDPLNKDGDSYIVSGSPADSKNVTESGIVKITSLRRKTNDAHSDELSYFISDTKSYNKDRFTGTLIVDEYDYNKAVSKFVTAHDYLIGLYDIGETFTVTVSTDGVFSGTVYKPDTRVWRQDYKGTVYKSGIDNYYEYTVTIKYIDNSSPTIALISPSENGYFSKEVGHNTILIQGTVNDQDIGDTINIYYSIDGGSTQNISSISANGSNQSFSKSISTTTLSEGTHTIKVWATDNKGGTSGIVSRNIYIDKTSPTAPTINGATGWSKSNVSVAISHGTDSASGVARTECSLSGATTQGWTTYTGAITIQNQGETTIKARTIDKVGNISSESSAVIKIDKVSPSLTITNNDDDWHKTDRTVTITHSDSGGSGVSTKRYSITNNTTKPTSGWIDLTSASQSITVSNDGNNYVHVQIIDGAGNETYEYKGAFKVDKTLPIVNAPTLTIESNKITVKPNASDNTSGLKSSPYLYNRDGIDKTSWISGSFTDTGLVSNTQYTYKYKAIDNANNEKWSPEVSKYTLALNPTLVKVDTFNTSSISFNITHNSSNGITPNTKIILKNKGTSTIKSESIWTKDMNITVSGLAAEEKYDVYLKTKNENGIENSEVRLTSSSEPPLKDKDGNLVDDITADKIPTIALINIEGNRYSEITGHNSIELTGTIKDLDSGDILTVKYTIDGVAAHTNKTIATVTSNALDQNYNYSINVDNTILEGNRKIRVWVEDNRGGKSTEIVKNIVVDKSAPQPTYSPNGNISWQKQHSTIVTVIDNFSTTTELKYKWSNSSIAPALDGTWLDFNSGGTISLNNVTGEWYLHIYTKDNLGNEKMFTSNKFNIDNTIPNILFSPTEIDWTINELSVDINTSDNESGVKQIRYAWTNSSVKPTTGWSAWQSTATMNAKRNTEGAWYLHVEAEDNLGNIGYLSSGEYRHFKIAPVANFKLTGTTVSKITVTWDNISNQQFQVYALDEKGNEVARGEWVSGSSYTLEGLASNTKHTPYIITRRSDYPAMQTYTSTPVAINNPEKAYTDAQGISRGTFVAGEDYIELRLAVESLTNPSDTEYIIRNNITGQTQVVTQANPVWKNEGLAKEAEYEYFVKVINKNGKESYFTKLIFEGGPAHTRYEDVTIPPDIIDKPGDGVIEVPENGGELVDWFDPDNMEGKYVNIDGEEFMLTRKSKVLVSTTQPVLNATEYSIPHNYSGSYTVWNKLKEDKTFAENVTFNNPGFYRISVLFRNQYGRETEPIIKRYLADWQLPTLVADKKIKSQTAVTGDYFTITVNVKDNISPWLFYSIDNGGSWYRISDTIMDIHFTDIQKSVGGILNCFTIKVADICGNVIEKTFDVWGIEK